MVNWRNTRVPKLEEEDEITSVFEMVINETYSLGFQFCSFKMSAQHQNNQNVVFEKKQLSKRMEHVIPRSAFLQH